LWDVKSLGGLTSYSNDKFEEKELIPSEVARNIENQINALIDEAASLKKQGNNLEALDKAKAAAKKEESLRKYRKEYSLANEGQVELTFAVWFSVACCYEVNDLLDEVIKAYTFLTKQRQHPLSGRVRINLGNIHYAQHDYPSAIKMYKMALDTTFSDDKQSLANIRCNIGNAYFHQGHLRDAVKNFEESMIAHPNHQAGFNLLICHLALGDSEKCKMIFTQLIKIRSSDGSSVNEDGVGSMAFESEYDAPYKNAVDRILLSAARLVAPFMSPTELGEILKDSHENLALKMECEYAICLLKDNDIERAVKMMKSLEKKSPEMKVLVATNLSFVHFSEGDVTLASDYADIALDADRYNAKALVNKGNCLFVQEDYASAKDLYLEAIGVEADCAQAIFNLGLSNARLDLADEAIQAFEKLHSITPNNPVAIYHIADIYENQGQLQDAIKWFSVLIASHNSDSMILARLADLYSKIKDDAQQLHYHLESFRHFPTDLDVVARIGAWFVKEELFEKAIYFFQQAALVQPKEIKWSKDCLCLPH
jgi:intraflagellar transport protein 88